MSGRFRALLPALAVAALALAGAPAQVSTAWSWLEESPRGIGRDEEAARRELRGAPYAVALSEAMSRIPPGSTYGLADEGGLGPDKNWIRCDLAPRVPTQMRPERCGRWFFERPPKRVPDVTVVVAKDGAVRLAETRALLSSLWSGLTGPEVEIPGWLDAPAEGKTVAGPVVVTGWCQEKGSRPCPSVRVWMDGAEIDPARVERFPRRELETAIPGMGDSSRAGWRLTFEAGALAPGLHCVAAALVGDGGRHRRVGPWAFTVAP